MAWSYVPLEPLDVRGAFLVVGGPGLGDVGGVAASVLVETLGMRPVGGFQADGMPPVGVVRKGRFLPPLQVWASEEQCGPDGACDRLLVLRCDLRPPLEALVPVAEGVVRWAVGEGVRLAVAVDGYPPEAPQAHERVLATVTDAARAYARDLRAAPVQESILTGFSAAFLLASNRGGLPAIALFAPLRDGRDHAEAASAVLGAVDPLVPRFDLDPAELAARVRRVETRIHSERDRLARDRERLRETVDVGYA